MHTIFALCVLPGLGLHVWSAIDAHKQAKKYNQRLDQRRANLAFSVGSDRVGLALNWHF